MRALALVVLLTSCGGQSITEQAPPDAFVDAACLHIGCPGWPSDRAECETSWTMAVERAGAMDAACVDAATSVLRQSACGAETDDAADGVLNGKCAK